MKDLPSKTIIDVFQEFCHSTLTIQGLDEGMIVTCSHGRYGIGYKDPNTWLDVARRKHSELSSSNETRYNWL